MPLISCVLVCLFVFAVDVAAIDGVAFYSLEKFCARYAHIRIVSEPNHSARTHKHRHRNTMSFTCNFCQLLIIIIFTKSNRIRRQTCSSLINCVFGCLFVYAVCVCVLFFSTYSKFDELLVMMDKTLDEKFMKHSAALQFFHAIFKMWLEN